MSFESARNRNRTCTSLRTADFESAASTNSAIRAKIRAAILQIKVYLSKTLIRLAVSQF